MSDDINDRDGFVIRRTATGWRVGGEESDLVSAMVLADLLCEELPDPPRPAPTADESDEVGRLRVAVSQLEYGLATRVVVEQAIGVIAERQRVAPRQAFERLRTAARARGDRVRDLARQVVATASNPLLGYQLPEELTRDVKRPRG
ncbi:MAG: ANTAR domain-containing protein [Nocardioidaceae bacterium]